MTLETRTEQPLEIKLTWIKVRESSVISLAKSHKWLTTCLIFDSNGTIWKLQLDSKHFKQFDFWVTCSQALFQCKSTKKYFGVGNHCVFSRIQEWTGTRYTKCAPWVIIPYWWNNGATHTSVRACIAFQGLSPASNILVQRVTKVILWISVTWDLITSAFHNTTSQNGVLCDKIGLMGDNCVKGCAGKKIFREISKLRFHSCKSRTSSWYVLRQWNDLSSTL